MVRVCLLLAVVSLCSAFASEQTAGDLANGRGNTDNNVPVESMGFDRTNYSPLKDINTSNVKRLAPVWNASLMNDAGELAAPVVYNGVMYLINGRWTFAIDVGTGRQIWRTAVEIDPGVQRVAPFGTIPRGAPAIYNGKLFRVTLDNHLIALDMKTGREVWNQTFADWREGYTATGAPIVANHLHLQEPAVRDSRIRAWRQLRATFCPAPGPDRWLGVDVRPDA